MRTWFAFAAAVSGALLMAAGIIEFHPTWLFLACGALSGLAGLAAVGERGGVPLLLAGGWLLVTALVGWASTWNALVGGILVVATGFLATAGTTTEAAASASD